MITPTGIKVDSIKHIQSIRKLAANNQMCFSGLVEQRMFSINITEVDVKEILIDPHNEIVDFLDPGPITGNDRVVILGSTSSSRRLKI